jgi:hypothetical protein
LRSRPTSAIGRISSRSASATPPRPRTPRPTRSRARTSAAPRAGGCCSAPWSCIPTSTSPSSAASARLKAAPGLLIPSDFHLVDITAGKAYEAITAWRRYPYVGVAIRNPMDLADPTSRLGRRLRTLWLGVIN